MDGGFLIDEDECFGPGTSKQRKCQLPPVQPANNVEDQPECIECLEPFPFSFLYKTFEYPVCDACKDLDDKHRLMTRTDAKEEYLLKDCDLDLREPGPLRFLARKNPHNAHWGDMRLYLRAQVESRALQVWPSLEAIAEAKESRQTQRQKLKAKRFTKRVLDMRKTTRSDFKAKSDGSVLGHQHQFDGEKENKDGGFTRRCRICGFTEQFEKM